MNLQRRLLLFTIQRFLKLNLMGLIFRLEQLKLPIIPIALKGRFDLLQHIIGILLRHLHVPF
ncbi:hypothetical protein D3C78_1535900 [compost metagenome]